MFYFEGKITCNYMQVRLVVDEYIDYILYARFTQFSISSLRRFMFAVCLMLVHCYINRPCREGRKYLSEIDQEAHIYVQNDFVQGYR